MADPLRILILEDRPDDAALAQHELRRAKIAAYTYIVSNGEDFRNALDSSWDIILGDYRLPGFDALAALDLLRERKLDIPFIVVTATLGDEAAAECIKRGAADYLLKDRMARLGPAITQVLAEARARRERQKANMELQALIDCSPLAIVAMDTEFRVLTWSKAAEKIFGYTSDEVVGKPYALVPEEYRDASGGGGVRVIRAGDQVRNMSVRRRRKDGAVIDVLVSGAPLHDSADRIIGAVYTFEDVTEKKKVEEKLVQAQKMEAVGQLTGGIAHDFNNILGVVVGNLDQQLEFLKDAQSGARHHDNIRALSEASLNAALRGAELVQRLLAFARNQPLLPKLLDLGRTTQSLVPLLQRSIGEHVLIETRIAPDLWPVMADQSQFENAILNLAINARDAMPGGGRLRISCTNVSLDEAAATVEELPVGDYAAVMVTDTGTGIAPDVLLRVFEPFYTTKEVGKGSGLGLSMVFGYARQSGGTVKIYSELGKGTEVRLYLPRADTKPLEAAEQRGPSAAAKGSERILVVEDKDDVRVMAVSLLTSLGYRTIQAENATMALASIDSGEAFDLLFTDIIMPGGMNGLELAREVRRRMPKIPIIFTTGFSDPDAIGSEAEALGASVVTKPFRKVVLAEAVRQKLDETRKTGR